VRPKPHRRPMHVSPEDSRTAKYQDLPAPARCP
jgi:hypothetical protein